MQERWKRLGWSPEQRDIYVEDALQDDGMAGRYVDIVGPCSATNPAYTSEYGRKKDLDQLMMKVNALHLQMIDSDGMAKSVLESIQDIGKDYFLGKWRNYAECEQGTLDSSQCRAKLTWFDEFRVTMLACSILGDNESIRELSTFARSDLPSDGGAWDYLKEDNFAYIVLSHLLTNETTGAMDQCVELVAKSRRKRPKVFLQGAIALANQSATDLNASVKTLATEYSNKDISREGLMVSSWDASILYNLALTLKIEASVPPLPLGDFVITKLSIGMSTAGED